MIPVFVQGHNTNWARSCPVNLIDGTRAKIRLLIAQCKEELCGSRRRGGPNMDLELSQIGVIYRPYNNECPERELTKISRKKTENDRDQRQGRE
jgi:hypothetical protein